MKPAFLALLLTSALSAQPWAGIIASSRAIDWSTAGVVGGIPSGTWSRCTTGTGTSVIAAGASAATINTAMGGCDSNHYVELGAGSFSFTTSLLMKSNVGLRGQGADQTLLAWTANSGCNATSSAVCFQSGDVNYKGSPQNLTTWTAGFAAGATTITISAVTSLSVGDPITLDQLDDAGTDLGAIYISSAACCATNGDGGGPRTGRGQQQIVNVASCDGNSTFGHACSSGTNITITPGLYMPNWDISKTPQAWYSSSPLFNSGIESLSIDAGAAGANVGVVFFNCSGCWAKAVRTVGPFDRSAVQVFQANHISLVDSYIYKTNDTASVNYGFEAIPGSDVLVQNNIFEQVQAPYPVNGTCSGCVFAYNFDVNNVFTSHVFQNQSGFAHAVGNDTFLLEGNIGSGFNADNFHGTHHLITQFRNYWNGYQLNEGTKTTQATTPIILDALSRFFNVVGNVLGNGARQTVYENAVGNPHAGSVIYDIGFGNGIADDSNTVTTLMRWGNYDIVNASNQFNNSEVPSGLSGAQAAWANPVPATQTLPASFYLSGKPAWVPASKAWPLIGPDVSGGNVAYCVGGTYDGTYVLTSGQCPSGTATTLAGGRIISNPAMDCYLNTMSGPPDGTGAVLTFNAGTCFPLTSGGGSGSLGSAKMLGAGVMH